MVDPSHYLEHETLRDGTEVTVRAIRAEDAASIVDAFGTLDRESIYRRFFTPKKELSDAEIQHLTRVDFDRVVALVVTAPSPGGESLIAGARYAVEAGDRPKSAELAFLTIATHRGRGTAGLLLKHLAKLAREAGLSQFEAEVLAEIHPCSTFFAEAAWR